MNDIWWMLLSLELNGEVVCVKSDRRRESQKGEWPVKWFMARMYCWCLICSLLLLAQEVCCLPFSEVPELKHVHCNFKQYTINVVLTAGDRCHMLYNDTVGSNVIIYFKFMHCFFYQNAFCKSFYSDFFILNTFHNFS